jgi:DNA modification methylase
MMIENPNYSEFLRSKIVIAPESGFEVSDADLFPALKPHVAESVKWMIRGGRRALFSSFGLHKTVTQLECLRLITAREPGKALIVAPLNVVDEFYSDAATRLDGLPIEYIRNQHEAEAASSRILITNYERVRDGDIEPGAFVASSLDEASVLRSYGSKTYQEFLPRFGAVPYRFVATATPSPNRFKELIHYAGYLGIMDTGQALTRFFHRDSTQANNLTLYPHKEKEFWFWLSTWALFITKPSDISPVFSDEGYVLPDLDIHYHKVDVDHATAGAEDDGQVKLFRDSAMGLKDAAREKRDSIDIRVETMKAIIDEAPEDHFILWHDLEAERHAIAKALPEAEAVYGSQDVELNTEITRRFKRGESKYLPTKPDISGQGGNLQHFCHRAIYLGIGYKFNDFIQSIHRLLRFGQDHQVRLDIIYAESEQTVLDTLLAKWQQHKQLVENMVAIIREYGLGSTSVMEKLARTIGIEREVVAGRNFTAVLNDNVLELSKRTGFETSDAMAKLADNSVDLIHTSIPFSNHYEYTPTYNDFGHNEDNARFFEQMDYLTPELLRVLKPGRVAAIHVKDRILFGNATGTGMPTVDPFSDLTTAHFLLHGFQFMGRITIVTDVVRENNQTYRLGWTEQCKDGTKMGIGCPEYILLFRKLPSDTSRAYADEPVTKTKAEYPRARWQIDAHGFWRSSGDRLATLEELRDSPVSSLQARYREYSRETVYNYAEHVKLAEDLEEDDKLPSSFMVVAPGSWTPDVWDDINRMRTLNGEQARKELTMHICPLQFDIVERIITRFSNPGELVLDPFAGLFTVTYMAIKLGRRGYGIELNRESFQDGLRYPREIERDVDAPTLFDLIEAGA